MASDIWLVLWYVRSFIINLWLWSKYRTIMHNKMLDRPNVNGYIVFCKWIQIHLYIHLYIDACLFIYTYMISACMYTHISTYIFCEKWHHFSRYSGTISRNNYIVLESFFFKWTATPGAVPNDLYIQITKPEIYLTYIFNTDFQNSNIYVLLSTRKKEVIFHQWPTHILRTYKQKVRVFSILWHKPIVNMKEVAIVLKCDFASIFSFVFKLTYNVDVLCSYESDRTITRTHDGQYPRR